MAQPEAGGFMLNGARLFYEGFRTMMRTDGGIVWPPYDELDADQARAWMLAQAAAMESAVRYGDAAGLMPGSRS